jgi:hypothetical protein
LGQSQGVEFITLSAAEKATWRASLAGVIPAWVAKMVAAGRVQSDVEGWIDFIRGRIDYWTAEQVAAGVPFLVSYP